MTPAAWGILGGSIVVFCLVFWAMREMGKIEPKCPRCSSRNLLSGEEVSSDLIECADCGMEWTPVR